MTHFFSQTFVSTDGGEQRFTGRVALTPNSLVVDEFAFLHWKSGSRSLYFLRMNMTRVAVGILRKNGKILACQRKKGSRYELKWEFPGGKLETGETPLQCIQRELREELSITVDKVQKMEFQSAFYEDGGKFEVAYCHISEFGGDPKNNVFESIRWVDPAELRQLDILEGNRSFVEKLTSHER